MAVLKCKMCGGNLDVQDGMTVCECEYCGSKQTIPTVDDEKKMKLFDRANRLRFNCEFDKAGGVYESIIEEFPEEAEGYWGNLLCKYGIEYVDDPATGDKVPTCHRSSFESIMDDEDFELVMENADSIARGVYREQAKQIEELRKGIVEISAKEKPYDIFICYKETDENGDRTLDSVLAQDVYEALTNRGYRVFFSRISLEDKLGVEYEPYIFAALNSAKVMLAFGTSYDYYNAVWVKNEWGRFLRLMAKDKTKYLIPCYKDIDAYDMPKEFARLQAQDMGKVGAVQDLLRGIDKLTGKENAERAVVSGQVAGQQVTNGGPGPESLLERGKMYLEDGMFKEATEYFDRVLDMDPKSSEAYLGIFMTGIQVKTRDAAMEAFVAGDYTDDKNWVRARQFATNAMQDELQGWEQGRNDRLAREAEEAERLRQEKEREKLEFEEKKQKINDEITLLQEQIHQIQISYYAFTDAEQAEMSRLKAAAEKADEAAKQAELSLKAYESKGDLTRLTNEIRSKEHTIEGLGIFKGKEKRELQTQIDALKNELKSAEKTLKEKHDEVDSLKRASAEAGQKVREYQTRTEMAKKTAQQNQIKALEKRIDILKLKKSDIGDKVFFGHYAQEAFIALPIEWIVLDRKDNRLLLISRCALDSKRYHETKAMINWKTCSLRTWLNSTFLSTAFYSEERKMIQETMLPTERTASDIPKNSGIVDKIFLLNKEEVTKYFPTDKERKCALTKYAIAQGAQKDSIEKVDGMPSGKWWIRVIHSLSLGVSNAPFVAADGSVDAGAYKGTVVNNSSIAVRPALWIDPEG